MKSILILRSPVYQRKKMLGFFKTSRKELGNFSLPVGFDTSKVKDVAIFTTSYTRCERTAKRLCSLLGISIYQNIFVRDDLHLMNFEESLDLLRLAPSEKECIILITPGNLSSKFNELSNGNPNPLSFGESLLFKMDIEDWKQLDKKHFENKLKMAG